MQKKEILHIYKLDPKTKYRLIFHLKLLLLTATYSECFCGLTSDIYTSQHMINRCKGYIFPAPYLSIKKRHLCKNNPRLATVLCNEPNIYCSKIREETLGGHTGPATVTHFYKQTPHKITPTCMFMANSFHLQSHFLMFAHRVQCTYRL